MAEPTKAGDEVQSKWAQVVARAWSDDAFKRRLLTQTAAVLGEAGLVPPEGIEFKVVEDTERLCHLILPPAPGEGELSEETLEAIAGGNSHCFTSGPGGCATYGGPPPPPSLRHLCLKPSIAIP